VGEPWWWVRADGRPCLYDEAAVALFAPVAIASVAAPLSLAQCDTLDQAGAVLAGSTAALCAAVVAAHPGCETHLLAYLPTVLDRAAPEAKRMNLPIGWASPAFDVLQLEDYDWVTAGDVASTREGVALASARLGYPAARQDYLAGFVLRPEDKAQWAPIEAAAAAAWGRGVRGVHVWALPQVMRAVEGASVMLDQREPVADAYGGGTLRWIGGAACGLEQAILQSDDERVTLSAEAAVGAAPGLLVLLREGCDKTVATCVARFGNIVNFRGEPYLPGMDLLTRYPGA